MFEHLDDYKGDFTSDEIKLMTKALDASLKSIHGNGSGMAPGHSAAEKREELEKYIIDAARKGERNQHQLSEIATASWTAAHLK